jgi:dipeptidyl-peptidase 4
VDYKSKDIGRGGESAEKNKRICDSFGNVRRENRYAGEEVDRLFMAYLSGRGKRLLDSIYLRLGITEIDDMAVAVKALGQRPYVDPGRVGIYGTSYGGYASLMCLLRYPDLFHAASSSSPVTDWKLYNSIYTERYMWLPQENREGYDAASAMNYVERLKGRLMLYYGTADNNVHPSI